ncbi:MAG TPA: hypothetical protein VI914_07045 [Thermodesulfobacteriota bacterium]|nr:hypothetical protein [Thermodesulfobacteriota bacterium]
MWPITVGTARRCGLKGDIMPKEYTIPGLVETMAGHFGEGK